MQEKEFNLLTEPWIRVSTRSLEQKEVSLMDAMLHAQEYAGLAGEMPTQDAALLRVLLAAALTIFYRYDENGNEDEISEENDSDDETVLERWKKYWERGSFPETAVREYFQRYSERFWLFHPETPFWQVNELSYGTEYGVECLVGNLKESNNKATRHHFSMTEGERLERITYAEAVRWIIHLNAYGVNVKTDKKAPGPNLPVGVGRLGQLGMVMVNGDDLFRIIMLNLCPLKNSTDIWNLPRPIWEQEIHSEQGREIAPPDNLPELYTIQSRRIKLDREDGWVVGYQAAGGDFYPTENDFNEPMTLWKEQKVDKKSERVSYIPRIHNPSVQVWEEFPSLMCVQSTGHIPGVVQWVSTLNKTKTFVSERLITFKMIGIVYGDQMKYTYGYSIHNTLTMSSDLLMDLGGEWISAISDEVEKCQNIASKAIGRFSSSVCKLFGGGTNYIKAMLVQNYYFHINIAFREWLSGIEPLQGEREKKIEQWEQKSYYYAKGAVEEFINMRCENIYAYKEDEGRILTIPQALNVYLGELRKIYPKAAQLHGKERQ